MALRIVQLGKPRQKNEGVRLGTVRRPPRGVPREEFASRDYYDVWLPNLSPSAGLMKRGQAAATAAEWEKFRRAFRAEMGSPEVSRVLDVLAALSHSADFSVGCYCEGEAHCHRSVLRELFEERGASIV
jgi:uncharacterized protein YeaO (DUF488 family)